MVVWVEKYAKTYKNRENVHAPLMRHCFMTLLLFINKYVKKCVKCRRQHCLAGCMCERGGGPMFMCLDVGGATFDVYSKNQNKKKIFYKPLRIEKNQKWPGLCMCPDVYVKQRTNA